jgi:hypothetical protein
VAAAVGPGEYFRSRKLALSFEAVGDGWWAHLTSLDGGRTVWPRFGKGKTREEAALSAQERYSVEQT